MGMGGADLFYCRKDRDGRWGTAKNMGYPINTCADEYALLLNAQGDMAYISSDKLGGSGKMDIYRFELYQEARPNPVTYFRGVVFNKETRQLLRADFELSDLSIGKTIARSVSDSLTGDFMLILPTDNDYALSVSKPGYLFYSDHFSLTGVHSVTDPFIRNIPLQEVRVGERVVLRNIFFDTDKYDIRPESEIELGRLIRLLQENPGIRIELSGHTDNVGTREHNEALSLNRAMAVCDYLLGRGIAKERISYAGYGFSKPIDTNETEAGRSNNRRTEFKIIGK
jgi:flagellar motor protein MotB